jgi:SOS-response transcriptional repressor LexA
MKDREKQLLEAVVRLTADRGFAPTMREIAPAVGVSLTRISQLMDDCERQGFIRRHPRIARTCRVIVPVEVSNPPARRGRRLGTGN